MKFFRFIIRRYFVQFFKYFKFGNYGW